MAGRKRTEHNKKNPLRQGLAVLLSVLLVLGQTAFVFAEEPAMEEPAPEVTEEILEEPPAEEEVPEEPAVTEEETEEAEAPAPAPAEEEEPELQDLTELSIDPIPDQTFTGSAIEPDVVLPGLTAGTDYAVTYENNLHAGTATVTATGIEEAGYQGTVQDTFTILPASLNGVKVTGLTDKTYTGKAVKGSPKLTYNGIPLTSGTDYTVSYKNNTKIGTASVTFTGKGDFTGTKTGSFKIVSRKAKTVSWCGVDMTFTSPVLRDTPLSASLRMPRLVQTAGSVSQKLEWSKVSDSSAIDGYIILRRTGTGKYKEVGRAGRTTASYTDKTAKSKDTWYAYVVVPYKKSGTNIRIGKSTPWSGAVNTGSSKVNGRITLNKTTAKVQRGDKVTLKAKYTANSYSTTTRWYTSNSKVATVKGGVVTCKVPGTVKITAKAPNGRNYTCTVTVTERIKPATPSMKVLSATPESVTLYWTKAKHANGYDVYGAGPGESFHKLTTTKARWYTHKGLTAGKVYRYYVVPKNSGGGSYTLGDATPKVSQKAAWKRSRTTIKGVPRKSNKAASSAITFTVTVDSAQGGRTLQLQQYNSSTKKWVTRKTYTVKNGYTGKVKISIPSEYRKRTIGKWRVYAPTTKHCASGASSSLVVTTPNVGSCYVSAASACIYCVDTGQFIYTKNYKTRRAQASTTKLMTAVLLVESGRLYGSTRISANAAGTPWANLYMTAGDTYSNLDLLYAMMLPSSNDAATAVIETVGGGYYSGVAMMNTKAQKLGLKDTHFMNPHGLDASGHYSTAADLAKLTAYAYTKPILRSCWLTSRKTITSYGGKSHSLVSTDQLLGYSGNFKGGKTGTTDWAACCFTGVYVYGGKTYVTVVLGSGYGYGRWSDTKALHQYIINYGGSTY